LARFWNAGDSVNRAVALLLLAMSVAAWVLIFWKAWVLRRAQNDIARAVPAFWDAQSWADGRKRLKAMDREGLLLPLLDGVTAPATPGTLQMQGSLRAQLTRRLRDALHRGLKHLQFGQVVLASVGSTAPFLGLFGTVWGVFQALIGMSDGGGLSIDRISGPIGEALIMTAVGIAVAVPAVLGYNAFGHKVSACEAELEGFAQDLLQTALDQAVPMSLPGSEAAEQPSSTG